MFLMSLKKFLGNGWKDHDRTFGADGNRPTGRSDAQGIEIEARDFARRLVTQLDCQRCTEREDAVAVEGHSGKISLRRGGGEFPGMAAVAGEGEVLAVLLGMLVISTGDDAVFGIAKGDGENSGGGGTVDDGSFGDIPSLAGVGRAEYASGFASGSKPHVFLSLDRDAGSAGGECAFSFNRRGKSVGWKPLPSLATVVGRD